MEGISKLLSISFGLSFLLIFSILILALWFVKKLSLKPFPKTMLLIIVGICVCQMIIFLFMAIYINGQIRSFNNLFRLFR